MESTEAIVAAIAAAQEKRFNEAVPMLQALINKRKGSWTLVAVMEWQDVSSVLLTRLYHNFHLYDTAQPLDRWANTVITNALSNLVRDNLVRYLSPCHAANSYGARCAYNEGGNCCGWTKSKIKDSSCKFYAKWLKKKQSKLAIASPMSLDAPLGNDPESELSLSSITPSEPGSFVDVDAAKKIIDTKVMKLLDKEEAKIYRLLYIQHLEPVEVGKKMRYKKQANSEVPGYIKIKGTMKKARALAEEIVRNEGMCR